MPVVSYVLVVIVDGFAGDVVISRWSSFHRGVKFGGNKCRRLIAKFDADRLVELFNRFRIRVLPEIGKLFLVGLN